MTTHCNYSQIETRLVTTSIKDEYYNYVSLHGCSNSIFNSMF